MANIENTLFTYEEVDGLGTSDLGFVYYGCTLLKKVGPYPAGTYIHEISIDFDESRMQFYDYEEQDTPIFRALLELSVIPSE